MEQKIGLTLREIKRKTLYFIWQTIISIDGLRCPNPTHIQEFTFPQLVMEILTFPYGVGKLQIFSYMITQRKRTTILVNNWFHWIPMD